MCFFTTFQQEKGVVAFYSAKDVPGLNSFSPVDDLFFLKNEEIFCSGEVQYYNQPVGVIVAETQHIADRAANLVDVTYSNVKKPVIDVKEAVKDPNRLSLYTSVTATNKGTDVSKVIKGSMTIYQQYPFCMETLCSVSIPSEDGLEVHAATQLSMGVQVAISRALNMPLNK